MAKFVKHFSFVMVLIVLISAICMPISAEAATAKGTISAVTNTASGIKVKWTKDSTKAGYYIYRKSGSSGTYKKVKTVKSASTTSWTDTNVTNGTKYVYKVRSYKGSKITANNSTKTIYRMAKPTITVSRASGTSIKVKASNSKATGFQIRYSTKSNFSSYKSVSVAGTSLNKTLKSLAKNTKYYVKVRAYKTVSGKKYYGAFSSVKSVVTTAAQSGTDVAKATISSLTRVSETSVNVQAADAKATGFQIYYGTDSAFASYKTINVAGTNLDKTITNLTKGMKYYVKVRAYKTVNDAKIYGAFSDVKNVVTYYTAYTSNLNTTIYAEASTSSEKTTLKYMTAVTIKEIYSTKSSGLWQKLTYNGSNYYVWLTKDISEKFTDIKTSTDPYSYTSKDFTQYQNDVIEMAVKYANEPTEYTHGESKGELINGRYGFDCSGFTSYIMDTVMQKYVPTYHINSGIEAIYKTNAIYNKGTDAEFSAITVCEGSMDFSKMQPGDVIFWNLSKGISQQPFGWNHCGIYLGDNKFIHATPGVGIVIYPLEGVYEDEFIAVKRYIPTTVKEIDQQVQIVRSSEKVFSDKKYADEYVVTTLPSGDTVTLLFTSVSQNADKPNDNWAYVQYEQDGVTMFGYIYNPAERLAQ